MNNDVLWNFISPITGRILCDKDYVLVGDRQNIATPSPILIDIRLDLIKIKKDIENLAQADYVIGHPSAILKKAQVLSKMEDGFVYNTKGIVSIKNQVPADNLKLTYKHVFVGDKNNKAEDVALILEDNLPNLDNNNIWIGNASKRPKPKKTIDMVNLPGLKKDYIWKGDPLGRPEAVEFKPLGDLKFENIWIGDDKNKPQPNLTIAVKNLPDLTMSRCWVGNEDDRPVEFNLLKDLAPADAFYILQKKSDPLVNAQSLYSLEDGFMYKTTVDDRGVLVSKANTLPPLQHRRLWRGNDSNEAAEVLQIGLENLPDLPRFALWSGSAEGKTFPTFRIDRHYNLPFLKNNHVWVGDPNSIPQEAMFYPGNPIARYIIQEPDIDEHRRNRLPNAQALSNLFNAGDAGEMAFIRGPRSPGGRTGSIRKAKGGTSIIPLFEDDYVDPFSYHTGIAAVKVELYAAITTAVAAAVASIIIITTGLSTAIGILRSDMNERFRLLTLNSIATNRPTDGPVNFNGQNLINLAPFINTLTPVTNAARIDIPINYLGRPVADLNLNLRKIFNLNDPHEPLDAVNYRTLLDSLPHTAAYISATDTAAVSPIILAGLPVALNLDLSVITEQEFELSDGNVIRYKGRVPRFIRINITTNIMVTESPLTSAVILGVGIGLLVNGVRYTFARADVGLYKSTLPGNPINQAIVLTANILLSAGDEITIYGQSLLPNITFHTSNLTISIDALTDSFAALFQYLPTSMNFASGEITKLEVWNNDENKQIMAKYSEIIGEACGGFAAVPAFVNTKTNQALCGAHEPADIKVLIEGGDCSGNVCKPHSKIDQAA